MLSRHTRASQVPLLPDISPRDASPPRSVSAQLTAGARDIQPVFSALPGAADLGGSPLRAAWALKPPSLRQPPLQDSLQHRDAKHASGEPLDTRCRYFSICRTICCHRISTSLLPTRGPAPYRVALRFSALGGLLPSMGWSSQSVERKMPDCFPSLGQDVGYQSRGWCDG